MIPLWYLWVSRKQSNVWWQKPLLSNSAPAIRLVISGAGSCQRAAVGSSLGTEWNGFCRCFVMLQESEARMTTRIQPPADVSWSFRNQQPVTASMRRHRHRSRIDRNCVHISIDLNEKNPSVPVFRVQHLVATSGTLSSVRKQRDSYNELAAKYMEGEE